MHGGINDLLAYNLYKKGREGDLMKKKNLRSSLVCGQIINTCKISAN
jgi:hypothetical protein